MTTKTTTSYKNGRTIIKLDYMGKVAHCVLTVTTPDHDQPTVVTFDTPWGFMEGRIVNLGDGYDIVAWEDEDGDDTHHITPINIMDGDPLGYVLLTKFATA